MTTHSSTDRTHNITTVIERDNRLQSGTISYGSSGPCVPSRCQFTNPSTGRAQCCLTSATGQDRRSQRNLKNRIPIMTGNKQICAIVHRIDPPPTLVIVIAFNWRLDPLLSLICEWRP
jgi:hypothetical protein